MKRIYESSVFLSLRSCLPVIALMLGMLLALPATVDADDSKVAEDKRIAEMVSEFDQLIATGQGPAALQQAQRMRRRYADHPLVLAVTGQIQMMQNNVPGATASLNKALEKQPNQPKASALLANIEFRTGRSEQAYKRVQDALTVHPDNLELLVLSGQMKLARQELPEAEKVFNKILEMENLSPQAKAGAYGEIAKIKMHQGQSEAAVQALEEVMKIQWHPDVAMALIDQSAKAGNSERTLNAIRDFKTRLNNPQLAQIRQQALARLQPIERQMQLIEIENKLNAGERVAAKVSLDRFRREVLTNADADREYLSAVRRLDIIERTQQLRTNMKDGRPTDWLATNVQQIKELVKFQQGEHVDAALALAAEAQKRIDETQATEVPAVLELLKSGVTLQQLARPDNDMKEKLEEKGIKPYRELSSAAKQAIEDYFKPMAEARKPAPFESLMLPYLEKPADPALRQALLDSYWKQVQSFDPMAEGATRQQIIPDVIFTKPPSTGAGPAIPRKLKDLRGNDAFTVRDMFDDKPLIEAQRWRDAIEGYQRSVAIYPSVAVLEEIAQMYFLAGDYRAASDAMALCAAVDMYERAHSFGPDTSWIMQRDAPVDMWKLSRAQSLRALAEGRRILEGPGQNAALIDVLDDIKNQRWVEVAEYVVDHKNKHAESPMDSWFVGLIQYGPQVHRDDVTEGLVAAAEATNDPQRLAYLESIDTKGLFGARFHPVFALPKAKAAENDEQRLKTLRWAVEKAPRHTQTHVAIAEVLERQGNLNDALGHYNAAASGKKTADLTDPQQRAAALQRDRLITQLSQDKTQFQLMVDLTNQAYDATRERSRDRVLASLVEAYATALLELGIQQRSQVLSMRSDARRTMEDWPAAIEDLEERIRIDPAHESAPLIQWVIGICYKSNGQPEQAMQQFTKSIEAGFRDARVFNLRGDLYRMNNNTDAALADYSQAIEIDPNNQYALDKRSEIYLYVLKDDDKALADLEKIKALQEEAGTYNALSPISFRISAIHARKINRTFGVE